MNPRDIHIKDYSYELPEARIARYPLAQRDGSKLLVYRSGDITEDIYANIDGHLPENSVLVLNNTRVIQARLFFRNANGAKIEIFCLEPAGIHPDMALAMSSTGSVQWRCMIGRMSKWKEKELHCAAENFELTAEIAGREEDAYLVTFRWTPQHLSFAEILDKTGMMPIPPYLKRDTEEIDLSRYQTVYAQHEGSVAAPTAGLHFTPAVFDRLQQKNIHPLYVTLHVGAGTFKPVKSEQLKDHDMHAEWIHVSEKAIRELGVQMAEGRKVVSVGTTSLRTIESLYWMGLKAKRNPAVSLSELELKQWDVYDNEENDPHSTAVALQALSDYMCARQMENLICRTQILIAPPYRLRVADALVTNFHQPNSTLLLLVASVIGNDWRRVYDYALQHDFRFLSYGDGSLLWKAETQSLH